MNAENAWENISTVESRSLMGNCSLICDKSNDIISAETGSWHVKIIYITGGGSMAMGWLTKLCRQKKRKQQLHYTNNLSELFDTNFFVMFIPTSPLFGGEDAYKLSYSYSSIFKNETCYREDYRYEGFDTAYLLNCLAQAKFIAIELKETGTLVFTNHRVSALFHILQSHYKQFTSYVFCATDSAGYFKKLQDGKIDRKIASHLTADGITDYPEIRGKPCEFELAAGKIFKIDRGATWLDDMLKDFGKADILNLFDFYVGLSNIKNENIQSVSIYHVNENPNG